MTDEMTVNNPNPATIELNNPPSSNESRLSRKEQSEKRKKEFYEQLEKVRAEESKAADVSVTRSEESQEKKHEPHKEEQSIVADNKLEPMDLEDSSDEDDKVEDKLVPKKRFDKEIEKRKKAEEDLWKAREEKIKLETEFNLLTQGLNKLNKSEELKSKQVEIDPLDPDAHSFYTQRINELERKFNDQSANLTEYQQRQLFAETVDRQAAEFSKSKPDFNDAYSYLLEVEGKKARMLGYSDEQSTQYALSALQPIALDAYNNGHNVAEIAYKMAEAYGYKPTRSGKTNSDPDLEKVERNMHKSHSLLDEIQGVPTNISPDYSSLLQLDKFMANNNITKKGGRGIDPHKFREALDKMKRNTRY